MNTLSGNGLTIGQPLMPNYQLTIRQGDGGSPYTAPPKEKTGPFVPAPNNNMYCSGVIPAAFKLFEFSNISIN